MKLRSIKSFVKRQRKLTPRQEKAFAFAWPTFGIEINEGLLSLDKSFGRTAPKICEIGFGHGDTLIPMAKNNPDKDYLGIEVHEPGVASTLLQMIEQDIKNIRLIQQDAILVLQQHIPDNAFSRIHIYFPDPWPKKRHHKRRLIQANFVELLHQKLCQGGILHCATDWENYAMHMMTVLTANDGFKNCIGEKQFADNEKLHLRQHTKFENRGLKLGHGVWDVVFEKRKSASDRAI